MTKESRHGDAREYETMATTIYEIRYETRSTEVCRSLDRAEAEAAATLHLSSVVLVESSEPARDGSGAANRCWYVYASQADADADQGGQSLARIVEVSQ